MLINLINKGKAFYKLKQKVKNKFWFDKIRFLGLDQAGIYFRSEKESLIIEDLNLRLPSPSYDFILDGYSYLKQIIAQSKPLLVLNEDGFFITIEGVKLKVTTKQEILIVKEIFTEKIYNTSIQPGSVVIDIGMNVGYCSLFFASHKNVEKVYSFEPFEPTYRAGLANFKNNPVIEQKIEAFPLGLGNESTTLKFPWNNRTKGNASTRFENFKGVKDQEGTIEIEVVIKSGADVLRDILNTHKNQAVVLKIDCEGCEYEIFDLLHEYGILSDIDTIICEWHLYGPQKITSLLEMNNFHHFCISNNSQTGMIYATHKGKIK